MRELFQKLIHFGWAHSPKFIQKLVVWLTQDSFKVTVAMVITRPDGRLLLLHHIFRGDRPWGLPAGFVNRGETPEEAAVRELAEETGIEISPSQLEILAVRPVRRYLMEIGLALELADEAELTTNLELDGYEWVSPSSIPEEITEESRTLVELWARGQKRRG